MSRCFPFPPPGYEKKARTDDVDLLIKEKHKEKKHKKEKDKKKDGKDKKDKERSKDKDREKKDRKEKHKDKKKSKEKKRTDEKKVDGQPESSNGGKHREDNLEAEAFRNTRNFDGKPESFNGGMPYENNQKAVVEINRKIPNEERGRRNQMVENVLARGPVKEDVVARLGEKYSDSIVQGTEKIQDKDGREKKYDMQKVNAEGRVTGNTAVPNFTGVEQKRVGSTLRPMEMERDAERKMEGKERNKDPMSNVKQEGKHKHIDDEKKFKEKNGREMEKLKEKVKHENRKQDILIKPPNDHINTLNIKPLQIPKHSEQSFMEENLRKRKDCETNGLLHDNALSNKTPKPAFPSHPISMNGRKPEQSPAAPQLASAMHRGINSIRFDTKALKANGLLQVQATSKSSTSPVIPPVQAKENGEASKKPPHPDSKYLSTILSVPKMDDGSDFDDQEWLFSNDNLQAKKPKTVSCEIDGSTQVWDRALRIDSADVCALPYVIPY